MRLLEVPCQQSRRIGLSVCCTVSQSVFEELPYSLNGSLASGGVGGWHGLLSALEDLPATLAAVTDGGAAVAGHSPVQGIERRVVVADALKLDCAIVVGFGTP